MAVTVVLRHRPRHLLRRAWRQFVAFWAGMLVVAGTVSAALAVLTSALLGGELFGPDEERVAGQGPDDYPWSGLSSWQIFFLWVSSVLLTIVGLWYGPRLLRRGRGLVLFLRRFGHFDATQAITFAARKTVGGSWRLVTLDDNEIAPLGIEAGTRRFFSTGRRALAVLPTIMAIWFKRVIPLTLAAMLAVMAVELLRAPDRRAALHDGTFAAYGNTLQSLAAKEVPLHAIGWSLVGVFSVIAIVFAVEVVASFFAFFAAMVLALSTLLLLPLVLLLASSARAAEKAQQTTSHAILATSDIRSTADTVARASRNIFAPRLVVLRVAPSVWQPTVIGFAAVCSALLIDLSDVSDNVLWEVEDLTGTSGPQCVLVGQHDRVAWLAAPPATGLGANHARLLQLIDGQEVLAYTTGRRGTRRFARSLRAKLLTVTG